MKAILLLLLPLLLTSLLPLPENFRAEQRAYPRVRQAYEQQEDLIKAELKVQNLKFQDLNILLSAYKAEKQLDLWVKKKTDTRYTKLKSFSICSTSGVLGPKRQEGDRQIPEGFYHIDRFNPVSNYYLSLGINYPNQSDRHLGHRQKPGSNIFIHGACLTDGCLPMTDEKISELYVYAVEARNAGQTKIPVYIFPTRLEQKQYEQLKVKYAENKALLTFWENLKMGHDLFLAKQQELKYMVNSSGQYVFR